MSILLAGNAKAEIDFNRDIQPLLSENCFYCHGTDPSHREADLRLDLREEAINAGAIVPGDPAKSEIIQRMRLAPDDEDLMPPKKSHRSLTSEQITLIETWIAEGAEYADHWSFTSLPEATGRSIDEIVTGQLANKGMQLKPQAEPHALLRRLTIDLTGLPPTPEEVKAFDPNNIEDTIDRLLASPRFGEHMATPWLDIARYADTYGFQQDKDRFVWPYRDYVIEAFNKNKPFDRFIHEQLAGDLLPDADHESRLATAFSAPTQGGHTRARRLHHLDASPDEPPRSQHQVLVQSGAWLCKPPHRTVKSESTSPPTFNINLSGFQSHSPIS